MEYQRKVQSFRDLIAWQKGMRLATDAYKATSHMPPQEQFGLTSQMRRAAVSIPSNIAEGYARESPKNYLKFLRTARGSLAELATQMELATNLQMLLPNPSLQALLREEQVILQALITSLKRKQ